jgi:hypothetical protein
MDFGIVIDIEDARTNKQNFELFEPQSLRFPSENEIRYNTFNTYILFSKTIFIEHAIYNNHFLILQLFDNFCPFSREKSLYLDKTTTL